MKIKIIKKATWNHPSDKPNSSKFVCSKCGTEVYAKPAINRKTTAKVVCEYEHCPHCLSEMSNVNA